MSLAARLLNAYLRRFEKPKLQRAPGPDVLRVALERQARWLFHAPRGTQMQWHVLGAGQRRVDALEVVPPRLTTDRVVLYIHGGAFVFGSPTTHAAMAGALAARLGARVILPRYRLAPEHPFPAGPDDVRVAWDALIGQGVPAAHIVVGGDSAGGALAFGLLAALIAADAPRPIGVFGLSPLTDLTYSGPSFQANATREALLAADRAVDLREMYLQGAEARDPQVSPLFADFSGAPAAWLCVGDTEILRDDSRRMTAHLQAQGVAVTFQEEHDLPHVWPIFHNTLPEARQTLDALAGWIRQQPGWQGES